MSKGKILKLPVVGRLAISRDRHGSGEITGNMALQTNLEVRVFDKNGKAKAVKDYLGSNKLQRLWYGFLYRDGRTVLDLGSGVVTTAGVVKLSNDVSVSAGAAAFNVFKNHGSGTGTTAAAVGDTALQTAIGTTATAGTNTAGTSGSNATITSVATVAYTGTSAVTEWGLFSQTTLAGATMWDHKIFSAINVVNGDSIQFTYVLTLTAGG